MDPSITMIIIVKSKRQNDTERSAWNCAWSSLPNKITRIQPTSSTLHPVSLHFFSVFLSLPFSQFHFLLLLLFLSTIFIFFYFQFFLEKISERFFFLRRKQTITINQSIPFCFSSSQLTPNSIPLLQSFFFF